MSAAWSYRREFESKLGQIFEHLSQLWTSKVEGKLSQKSIKKMATRLLRIWKDANIYETRTIEGWEAMLKADKANYYSFNLRDGFFLPQSVKDKKLLEKLKLIVVPELKQYFKKLNENKEKLPIECKLSGVPIYPEDT